ncbi:MAG: hypothetical protein HOI66_17015, partial [Verrucomicrobia bacterium]|nr:hypothetical protein [Verrucomicrobiota bacterium]
DSRGIAEHQGLPEKWSATENVEWKVDLEGRGWSSPIVWGDQVFLTTVINQEGSETPQKGIYSKGNRGVPETVHEWWVYCHDLKSGKRLWGRKVHEANPKSAIHSMGDETVVFVVGDHGYRPRSVTVGLKDDHHAEVKGQIKPGENVVVVNGFTVKSELMRSELSDGHDH